MTTTRQKPYVIDKHLVYRAYEQVKANRGGCGIDRVSLDQFEQRLQDNLYKIWNRLSSGSYFPPPVRRVDIPKGSGGTRPLGIPTVGDRIAQMVVKLSLEPTLEQIFHPWSYGYRPGRSPIDAVTACRKNCWQYPWVVDMDIKGFFDAIDHDKLLKAVHKHAPEDWHTLYIERWLTASVVFPEGRIEERTAGTPQGGVISPLLANLFLHYVFDNWMHQQWQVVPFERFADDAVCHCRSLDEARRLLQSLEERFTACGLQLHPEKTKIVYCRERGRNDEWDHTQFTFLGYQFRCRTTATRKGDRFQGFNPAMSPAVAKVKREQIREQTSSRTTTRSLGSLAKNLNPQIRGWLNYYGHFRPSEFQRLVGSFIDRRIMHWGRRKYKRFNHSQKKAGEWFKRLKRQAPNLLAHWQCPA